MLADPCKRWALCQPAPSHTIRMNSSTCRCAIHPGCPIVVFDPVDNVRYISQQYGHALAVRDDVVIGGAAETTFGNVKADVLADKDPKFQRMNFCRVIRGSQWKG
jgi:hypothetical protein